MEKNKKEKGEKEEEEKVEEVEEDGPDIRQGGWSENGCDGGVARRQCPEDPEHVKTTYKICKEFTYR